MVTFSRRFGSKPRHLETEQLRRTIVGFLEAPTWPVSRQLVEAHPELLGEEADALLGQLLAAQRKQHARSFIAEHRVLLRRCRDEGIDAAFVPLLKPAGSRVLDVPEEFLTEIQEMGALAEQERRAPAVQSHYIDLMEGILRRSPSDRHSAFRAALHFNLGLAYDELPTGDPAADLARAIACYREALRFYTPEDAPFDYAQTQAYLGAAYADLPTGDRAANLARAIACYREALVNRRP